MQWFFAQRRPCPSWAALSAVSSEPLDRRLLESLSTSLSCTCTAHAVYNYKYSRVFLFSCLHCTWFLANVNSRSRSLYAIARSSVCRLSVCLSSIVCNVRCQPVDIFGNFSSPSGTLAINWHSLKILRRSSLGNPFVGGFKRKSGSEI